MAIRNFLAKLCRPSACSQATTAMLVIVLAMLGLTLVWGDREMAAQRAAGFSATAGKAVATPLLLTGPGYEKPLAQADVAGDAADAALPTVHADSPLAAPVMAADLDLFADRATAWKQGDEQMILLERQFSFTMGTYGFRADKALVRIEKEASRGRLIHHVWIYLDNARPLKGRGPLQGEAGRLLVTTSTTGQLGMLTNLLVKGRPPADAFMEQAQQRFTNYAWKASQPVEPLPQGQPLIPDSAMALRQQRRQELARLAQQYRATLPQQRLAELERADSRRQPTGSDSRVSVASGDAQASSSQDEQPRQRDLRNMILPTTGSVLFQYDRVAVQPAGDDELAIVFMGNVSVIYEPTEARQGMSLTASNAVVFVRRPEGIEGQLPDTRVASAQDVRGIYLEDNVQATNGQFTVRAPRVYYDLSRNKAVVLDAVMYAYDARLRLPIYVRAEKLRQESLNSWTAKNASLTTSEFAQPTLTLAAREVTFAQETAPDGGVNLPFEAKGTTVRMGRLPVFGWPAVGGDINTNIPIRSADVGYDSNDGPFVRTEWDLFSLMGRPQPEGVQMLGMLDFLGQRGPAVGFDLAYDRPRMFGQFEGYLLPHDTGDDRIGGRDTVDHDGDLRGFYRWQHRQEIQGGWEISLESAGVTDETFLEEFFPEHAANDKPWETSIYLKKQRDDWAFTFLGSYDYNSFTPQTTTLQAPGYRVDKLPELGYHRVGTSLWDNRLTYFSETTFSRMRLSFGGDKPRDRGFDNADSLANFGIPNTVAFGDAMRAAGLDSDWRSRFDTRHEIQAPMKFGFVDVVPYVSGRFTAYDDDFDAYAGEDDNMRLFATAGVRMHTQFHRTYDDVQSDVFNLHRLRHVFEPSIDLNYAGSSLNPEDIPVYDDDVERLQEGASFRFGLRNTLQTQRGGQGRWRSVDWLVLNTDFVIRSDDANDAIIPEYYSYRPEYGKGGDHFHTDIMWMISDTLAAVGELIYDFEDSQVAYWRIGASMEHSPVLTSFIEYSEIDLLDSRLLSVGAAYRLTRKWSTGVRYTHDIASGQARGVDLTMVRDLSDWRFAIMVSHDAVDDRQSVSVVFMPNFGRSGRTDLFGPVLAR